MPLQATSAIYLDRDGVINLDRQDYVKDFDEIEIYKETVEAFKILNALPYPVFVVTNQAGINKGVFSMSMARRLNAEILSRAGAKVTHSLICPHLPKEKCLCRKPETGMFTALMDEYHTRGGWMIGDSYADMDAALRLNLIPMLVMTGRGERTAKVNPLLNVRKYATILQAAEQIEEWHNALSLYGHAKDAAIGTPPQTKE